jgi:hypothetical protein
MWRYFYPHDKKVDYLWQALAKASEGKPFEGTFHLIEPLLWATDTTPEDRAASRQLRLPLTWFDDRRSSLVTRNSWDSDTGFLEFECRTDSVGASHEHADRGSFTFSALGRSWAKDNFRSVETRHHNSVLIDGMGQGYWPGPAKWLGMSEERGTLIASCDLKDNYSWWWPKEIITESPQSFLRFNLGRWESYRKEAEAFQQAYGATPKERDTRPSVVAFWKGYDKTDPRLWDEDTWPVRLPHNPVERAFRTIAFTHGAKPSLLVIDDIQKDQQERLYEWLLQTGLNTEVISINGNDILLTDATVKRDANGEPRPARGDRELLVRVLDLNNPAHPHDYQSRPSFRLETFERRDTLMPDAGPYALSGSRSFGAEKRLAIASRSVAPDFKVLLVPMRHGDSLPVTSWNADRSQLTIQIGAERTVLQLKRDLSGRTLVTRLEGAK